MHEMTCARSHPLIRSASSYARKNASTCAIPEA